jgi:hypothetical protein
MRLTNSSRLFDLATLAALVVLPSACALGHDAVDPDAPLGVSSDAAARDAVDAPSRESAVVDAPSDSGPRCGNGHCEAGESCSTCPADCGTCDSCAGASTCGACAAMANCGFCRNTNSCRTGTSAGPDDHSCGSSDWAWVVSACDACRQHTECGSCASAPGCGWCGATGTCSSGTSAGPSGGGATCSRWWEFGSSAMCPNAPSAYHDCQSCVGAHEANGWCVSSNTCFADNGSGTYPSSGSCQGGYTARRGDCTDGCLANTACGTCDAHPGCGWCERGGTGHGACLADGGGGHPANGATCDYWAAGLFACH